MNLVKAKIQTVEDMYRLISTAIANRRPMRAIYKDFLGEWARAILEMMGGRKVPFGKERGEPAASRREARWAQTEHPQQSQGS